MKNTIKNVFHSPRFVIGFAIFVVILLITILYPLLVAKDPLEMVGNGNFYKPGTYISKQDAVDASTYTMNIDTTAGRIAMKLKDEDKEKMKDWLVKYAGIEEGTIDVNDPVSLIELWNANYSADVDQSDMISADRKYFTRLNTTINNLMKDSDMIIAEKNDEGALEESKKVAANEFVNVKDSSNKVTFVLGTDNFGRDVLTELIAATATSLKVGLVAGIVATLIGLSLGLLAGYIGGWIDDLIMFFTNLFTVIPSFVILILISYSLDKASRGVEMVAVIIGITSWTWTTRSVRSQVLSLRNRDHVNLSKLSGHGLFRIVLVDVLPYLASYVVMAFILQISSGILAEAQLSMLGLGPATTETATLGLMMNWAMTYAAHLNGSWWAYFPVVFTIAAISFSLNLMNTGLDQVFNPALRD